MGNEARQAYGMDRHVPRNRLGGRLRSARGRIDLRLVVKLDDLRLGEILRGLGGKAHHQHCSHSEVRRNEAADDPPPPELVERAEIRGPHPGLAAGARDARLEAALDVPSHHVRAREVDRGIVPVAPRLVAAPGRRDLVPCLHELGSEGRPHFSVRAVEKDLHAAAAEMRSEETTSTALSTRFSLGPTAATDSRSRARSAPVSSATLDASTASISASMRSRSRSSLSVMSDLPSRLIRVDVSSIESMILPLRFSFARASSSPVTSPAATTSICSVTISRQAPRFSALVPTYTPI